MSPLSTARAALAISAALFLAVSHHAHAANQRTSFLGNDAALTAGSLMATTRQADAVWYNPAGLGGTVENKLELSASAFVLRLQGVDNLVNVVLPSGEHPQDISANEILLIPSALIFCRSLTDSISYGLGVFVAQWRDLRFNTHFERSGERILGISQPLDYSQGLDGQNLTTMYHIGPALGWQLSPRLRVGLSLFAIYYRQIYAFNLFLEAHGQDPDPSQALSTFFTSSASADMRLLGLVGSAGLQWEVTPNVHLGLVVRSPSMALYLWGDSSTLMAASPLIGDPSLFKEFSHVNRWSSDLLVPLVIQAGIGLTGQRHTAGLRVELAPPLETEGDLQVDTQLVWNVNLGGKLRLTESLYAGAGLYTDNSPSRTPRSFSNLDMDYYGLTLGGQSQNVFSAGSRRIVFSTTLVLGYAAGVGKMGGWNYDPLNIPEQGALVNRDVVFHELSVHVGSGLTF